MEIEVQNLIIIAVALIIVAILFSMRKKLKIAALIVAIALAFFGKAFWLDMAIKKAEELKNQAQQIADSIKPQGHTLGLDIEVDPDEIKSNVEETVDEALPDNLYSINNSRKGYGLDGATEGTGTSELIDTITDFAEDTNK